MVSVVNIKTTSNNIKVGYVMQGDNLSSGKLLNTQLNIKDIGSLYDVPMVSGKASIQVSLGVKENKLKSVFKSQIL